MCEIIITTKEELKALLLETLAEVFNTPALAPVEAQIDKLIKVTPVDWKKSLRNNTILLLTELDNLYGSRKIYRNSRELSDIIYKHRVKDFAQILRKLEEKNLAEVTRMPNGMNIDFFRLNLSQK